jgi:hypothetical protein
MTEVGFQKLADRRVQINVLAALETSPRRKKLQKHTCSSRSSRSNLEKPCPKSFPNKPGAVCPHDEFLIPQVKNCLWERKHVGMRRVSYKANTPHTAHTACFFPHACEAGAKCVALRSVFNGISLHPFEEAVQTALREPPLTAPP